LFIAAIGTIRIGIANPTLCYAGAVGGAGEALLRTLNFGTVTLIAAIAAIVILIADPTLLYTAFIAAGEFIRAAGGI